MWFSCKLQVTLLCTSKDTCLELWYMRFVKSEPIFNVVSPTTLKNNCALEIHFHNNFILECVLRNDSTALSSIKCSENRWWRICAFFLFDFEDNLFVVNVFVNFADKTFANKTTSCK